MTFKATTLAAEQAFDRLRNQAVASKAYLTTQRAAMQQATCDASVPLAVIQHLGTVVSLMNAWAATPGLAAYAQSQVNDPAYDIVAEFNVMRDAMVTARDTLIAMFPKDGSGFILWQTINVNGGLVNRTFTSAQLAGAVTQVNSVIAAID
jgi:hypothetical protein